MPLADRYQLTPQGQTRLLAWLRNERPRDERALHRQAFDHYVQRLAARTPQPDPPDEAAALHHLRALRELNRDYMR